MRKLASIIASAGVLVSLSACAAGPSTFAECAGSASNASLVSAQGAFGSDPAADFPTPLVAKSTEAAEIRSGDDKAVPAGGYVYGSVSVYDGETGEALGGASPLVAVQLLAGTSDYALPFADTLACAEVGARVATVGTNEQLFGASGIGGDIALDHTLVVVTDITQAFLGRADGIDQIAQSGMPAIVYAPTGQPGFTFPEETAPADFRADVLKRGAGAVTAEGDSLVVHYSAIAWGAATLTGSSWENGTPAGLLLDGAADQTTGIPAEVKNALVGLTVGSQLLAVVPGEQTLVYVIDVLGIAE